MRMRSLPACVSLLVPALLLLCSGCQKQVPQQPPAEETIADPIPAEEVMKDKMDSAEKPQQNGTATEESADALPQLGDKLAARKAKFAESAPAALRTLFADGLKQVAETGITEKAKQVGDQAPDGQLQSVQEESVALSSLWSDGPVVLVWYRGGWCPYCNLQLEAMQQSLPTIERLGAKVVALTPELPPKAAATQEKLRVGFQVLSDPGNELARKFGLVFKLPPKVAEFYKEKIKLEEYNGDDSYELPLSAVYVIDTKGKIRYAFLEADYTQRAEPADIVAALRAL